MKTQVQTTKLFDQQRTVGKLVFLALVAVAFCSVGPLAIFAPAALVISILLYGRGLTIGAGFVGNAAVMGVSTLVKADLMARDQWGLYGVALLIAIMIAEVILRNINPAKGFTYIGMVLILLTTSGLFAFNQIQPGALKSKINVTVVNFMETLKKQKKENSGEISSEEARAFEEFIKKPDELTNQTYSMLPSIVFVMSLIGVWLGFYVALRNSFIWRHKVLYTFSAKDFIQFRAPEYFVWPLIIALLLLVATEYELAGLPAGMKDIGVNLLYCLGVFYLFQGFGVYSDFLKYIRIGGFLKSMFIVFTFFMAFRFLAILGIFDLWFDFRKYFTNKKNEGDSI